MKVPYTELFGSLCLFLPVVSRLIEALYNLQGYILSIREAEQDFATSIALFDMNTVPEKCQLCIGILVSEQYLQAGTDFRNLPHEP